METLILEHDYKAATAGLTGRHAAPSHADQTVDRDRVVTAPDGRTIIAVLITQSIDPGLYIPAYELWWTVDDLPENRASAIGASSLRRIKKDDSLSKRHGVAKKVLEVVEEQGARQGILGYMAKPCREAALSRERPELLYRNERLIKRVDQLYKQYLPTPYAKQRAEIDKVPRYRLWDTAFSSIYLAKKFRTGYHRDRHNLRGAMTALMAMGEFSGGHLVLPRWRIAFALRPGDLLLFNPADLHGNLPIVGERVSAAFYCAAGIAECGK